MSANSNAKRAQNALRALSNVKPNVALEGLDLNGLRSEIDAVDNALLALIHRRIDIGHQVGELKRAASADPVFLRPAREAKMLRELARRHEEVGRSEFPTATILYIWRELIAATTAMEGNLRLALMTDEDRHCRKNAVLHFSATLDQMTETTGAGVINQVMSGQAELGVVSLDDTWWLDERLDLSDPNGGQVFARLPFIDDPAQRTANAKSDSYVIAKFGLEEPTGDDRTLVAAALDSQFAQSNSAYFLANTDEDCLIDLPGYLVRNQLDSNEPLRIVGRYAAPIVL